jgi:hypothetical protein
MTENVLPTSRRDRKYHDAVTQPVDSRGRLKQGAWSSISLLQLIEWLGIGSQCILKTGLK